MATAAAALSPRGSLSTGNIPQLPTARLRVPPSSSVSVLLHDQKATAVGSRIPGPRLSRASSHRTTPAQIAARKRDDSTLSQKAKGAPLISRRQALIPALVAMALPPTSVAAATLSEGSTLPQGAIPSPSKVFVAGATGQTGRRIVRLLTSRGVKVQAGVRSVEKAKEIFADVAPELIDYVVFDVEADPASLAALIDPEADAIVVATGFAPQPGALPNLLQPWQVDYTGTVHIVDAARQLGISRLVLISSLLTNGAAWGQLFNPNYILLNLFGLILVAKLQAEQYIQRSGINYTIVRPGGLRNDAPKANVLASSQDTLGAGSISRDSVAEVAVEALLWNQASYKIVEIVEDPSAPAVAFPELFAAVK